MINKSNEVYINHCGIETTDIGCEICDDVLYCYETTSTREVVNIIL